MSTNQGSFQTSGRWLIIAGLLLMAPVMFPITYLVLGMLWFCCLIIWGLWNLIAYILIGLVFWTDDIPKGLFEFWKERDTPLNGMYWVGEQADRFSDWIFKDLLRFVSREE